MNISGYKFTNKPSKRGKTPGERGGAARARVLAGILREAQVSYRGGDFAEVSRRRSGS
jgi:hypothetical protein